MKLPFFEEIKFTNCNEDNVLNTLRLKNISNYPYYFMAHKNAINPPEKIIHSIEKYFRENELSSLLPYPFFIVNKTDSIIKTSLPIVTLIKNLPSHFTNETRKLTTKEEILLNKVEVLRRQISFISQSFISRNDSTLLNTIKNYKIRLKFLDEVLKMDNL